MQLASIRRVKRASTYARRQCVLVLFTTKLCLFQSRDVFTHPCTALMRLVGVAKYPWALLPPKLHRYGVQ